MCAELPGGQRQSFSRSPGGAPAAATTQSPGRAAVDRCERAGRCALRQPLAGAGGAGSRCARTTSTQPSRAAAVSRRCARLAASRRAPRERVQRQPRVGHDERQRRRARRRRRRTTLMPAKRTPGAWNRTARRRREVAQPRADAQHDVRAAAIAFAASVPLTPMPPSAPAPDVGALAGRRLGDRDAAPLREPRERALGGGVPHAAARDDERPLRARERSAATASISLGRRRPPRHAPTCAAAKNAAG